MKRDPTEEEYKKITEAIVAGDRVQGTYIYLSITECGLTEAQEFIKNLTAELKSKEQEKQNTKQERTRNFWQKLTSPLKR